MVWRVPKIKRSEDSTSASPSPYDRVVAALREMGASAPDSVIETLYVRDGSFLGHVYRHEGGHAVWYLGSPTIEFYDRNGNLLRMVSLVASKNEEAA
jgi:hypothetical protein